jgi:surfeit locus 1 family protein
LWATLATAALGTVFLAAGAWQLRRAGDKEALLASFAQGAAEAPLQGSVPDESATALRYRRIVLHGRFDPQRQVLLDARVLDRQAGYEVLTPLRIGTEAVLVNRGWVAAPADRAELPDVRVSDVEREVRGLLDLLPRAGLRPQAAPAQESWPRRLLFPTAAEITTALGYPVHDYQVLLDAGEPDGYLRRWQPRLMTPRQHLGYAVQWFALAAALGVIYVALNLRSRPAGPRP